jgi:D-arabinose 1-dehydrogenase-like Zn-dependent alcohol dehydrogenase
VDDGVDLVIDFIGRSYFKANLNLLRRDGTLVFLAFMSGPTLENDTNIQQLLFKRLTLKGSTLRSRTVEYQQELLEHFERDALGLIVKVEVHQVCNIQVSGCHINDTQVFPWTKVSEAHKEMEANKNSGKVSLGSMAVGRSDLHINIRLYSRLQIRSATMTCSHSAATSRPRTYMLKLKEGPSNAHKEFRIDGK